MTSYAGKQKSGRMTGLMCFKELILRHCRSSRFLVRNLSNCSFGCDEETGDAGCVEQSASCDLARVDDACCEHVSPFACLGVEADVLIRCELLFENLISVEAGIFSNLHNRFLEGFENNIDASLNIDDVALDGILDSLVSLDQGESAAGDDAFLNRSLCGVESVLNSQLLVLEFCFGSGADLDQCYTVAQLAESFLELLLVIVALCVFDRVLDFRNSLWLSCPWRLQPSWRNQDQRLSCQPDWR